MDHRPAILRSLLTREQTPEDLRESLGCSLHDARLSVAALCGSGLIAQTSWDDRQHARRHRITDEGRVWLESAERGGR